MDFFLNRCALPLAAAVAFLVVGGCGTQYLAGSGTSKTESRAVAGISALDLLVPARVEITQGATESLTITADDNVLPQIETRVDRGVLRVRFHGRFGVRSRTQIRIALTVQQLEAVTISGSGDVKVGPLRTDALSVTINGSGDTVLEALEAKRLETSVRGSGDIVAAGNVESLEVAIAGSGDVKAARLQAGRVKIGIAGSGDVDVWAREALVVRIAGSGDVSYRGDPSVQKAILGSGDVKRVGPAPG